MDLADGGLEANFMRPLTFCRQTSLRVADENQLSQAWF